MLFCSLRKIVNASSPTGSMPSGALCILFFIQLCKRILPEKELFTKTAETLPSWLALLYANYISIFFANATSDDQFAVSTNRAMCAPLLKMFPPNNAAQYDLQI